MKKMVIGVLLLVFFLGSSGYADDSDKFSTNPALNNGKKWSIAYYEGGEYQEYKMTLIATVKGLMAKGWIEQTQFPVFKGDDAKSFWSWCSQNLKSNYLLFKEDAFYTCSWKEEIRKDVTDRIINRLNREDTDINLIIAMGTWAAQDLANDRHHTPTIAAAVSDALGSGLIKSYEDSGYDHFHARVDPLRYERQVRLFYDLIGFNKLGIMYEDTVRGRTYASVDKVDKVADERGFEIVRCLIPKGTDQKEAAEQSVKKCFARLCQSADAIYVPLYMGINKDSLPSLVEIANKYDTPTFSQAGSQEVKYGLLMSISQAEFKYIGDYQSDIIANIFNGAKPRQLSQFFEEPSKIAINLKTAQEISYDPSIEILTAADEIYQDYAWEK